MVRQEAARRSASRSSSPKRSSPLQSVVVHEGVGHGGDDGERERRVGQVDGGGGGAEDGQGVALQAEIEQAAPPAEGERAERHEGPDAPAPRVAGFEAGDERGHRGGGVAIPDFGGLERAIQVEDRDVERGDGLPGARGQGR